VTTSEGFISPAADTYRTRSRAPRLERLGDTTVGLVDSMLNPSGMWGQGILDAVERSIRSRHPSVTFERVSRLPLASGLAADRWAEIMKEKYAALVTAVGD
jgi:hypothetical protein